MDIEPPRRASHNEVYPLRFFVASGSPNSYGPDLVDGYRRAAVHVDPHPRTLTLPERAGETVEHGPHDVVEEGALAGLDVDIGGHAGRRPEVVHALAARRPRRGGRARRRSLCACLLARPWRPGACSAKASADR